MSELAVRPYWPYYRWVEESKRLKDTTFQATSLSDSGNHEIFTDECDSNNGLQKFLHTLDRELDVFETNKGSSVQQEINGMIESAVSVLRQKHTLFQPCRLVKAGSVAEGTKIGAMNEFDFLLVMDIFQRRELFEIFLHKHFMVISVTDCKENEHMFEQYPEQFTVVHLPLGHPYNLSTGTEIEETLDEARFQQHNEKQLDEARFQQHNEEILDEARFQQQNEEPLDEARSQQHNEEPLDEARFQQHNEEPLDEACFQQHNEEPLDEACFQQHNEEPLDEACFQQHNEEPLDEACFQQHNEEPLDEARFQQYNEEPLDEARFKQHNEELLDEARFQQHNDDNLPSNKRTEEKLLNKTTKVGTDDTRENDDDSNDEVEDDGKDVVIMKNIRRCIMSLFQEAFQKCLTDDWELVYGRDDYEDRKICASDIATTYHLRSNKYNIEVDIDVCLCIPITEADIAKIRFADKPNTENVQPYFRFVMSLIKESPGLEVFAIVGEDGPPFGIDCTTTRITASRLELSQFQNFGRQSGQVKTYRYAKCLASRFFPKATKLFGCSSCGHCFVKSYHLKNIILYMMNNHKQEFMWTESNVPNRVLEVFEILAKCIPVVGAKEFEGEVAKVSTYCTPGFLSLERIYSYNPYTSTRGQKTKMIFTEDSHKPSFELSYCPEYMDSLQTRYENIDKNVQEYFRLMKHEHWDSYMLIERVKWLLYEMKFTGKKRMNKVSK